MNMEVYIGNLAAKVTYSDLIHFFKGFSSKARIRIVEKRQQNGSKVHFGIAEFDSDKLARKAIRKLHRQPLFGRQIVLHEYLHRCYANENRAVNWRTLPWRGVERRKQDRRKQQSLRPVADYDLLWESLYTKPEKVRIEAYSGLARKCL